MQMPRRVLGSNTQLLLTYGDNTKTPCNAITIIKCEYRSSRLNLPTLSVMKTNCLTHWSGCGLLLGQLSPVISTAQTLDLNDAAGYNLLAFGDALIMTTDEIINSDVEGSVAVRGDLTIQNSGVASLLPSGAPLAPTLVVDGDLTATNGQLFAGSAYVRGTVNTTSFNIQESGAGIFTDPPIPLPFDFTAAQNALQADSLFYDSLLNNGTVTTSFGTVTIDGPSSAGLIIVDLDAATFENANNFVFSSNISAGTTVLVNVDASSLLDNSVDLANFGFNPNNLTASNILYNFSDAQNITLTGLGVPGSILAPFADILASNAQVNGQVITQTFNGLFSFNTAQINLAPFNGVNIPANLVPEPRAVAVVLALALALFGRFRAHRMQR